MSEYEAEGNARKIKTAKLRALRLEKEAADLEAEASAPPVKKTRRAAAKK